MCRRRRRRFCSVKGKFEARDYSINKSFPSSLSLPFVPFDASERTRIQPCEKNSGSLFNKGRERGGGGGTFQVAAGGSKGERRKERDIHLLEAARKKKKEEEETDNAKTVVNLKTAFLFLFLSLPCWPPSPCLCVQHHSSGKVMG